MCFLLGEKLFEKKFLPEPLFKNFYTIKKDKESADLKYETAVKLTDGLFLQICTFFVFFSSKVF